MSIPGGDALGRQALGQITNQPPTLVLVSYPVTPEPVRSTVGPGYQIALMASGGVIPPLLITPLIQWNPTFSEPIVKVKVGLRASAHQFIAFYPTPSPFVATGWRAWLSEPVRLKPGFPSQLQQTFTTDAKFLLEHPDIQRWFNWLAEPVRLKLGLSVTLQQALAYHPRILPKPNITATMRAPETNSDAAAIAVNVIQSQPAATANVSIVEVGSGNSGTSVREIGWY